MSLTFPTGPTNGQQTTTGGRTYQWNGQAWTLVGSGIAGPTGVTGPTGAAGTSGAAGSTGPTGTAGAAGATGPTGDGATNAVTTPSVLTANATVTGYNPGAGDIYRLAVTGTTGVNLWGLGITGPDGTAKLLINVGATAPITLRHATGTNGNAQFAVPWAGDYVMDRAGGAALVVYDATSAVWRVV
jgi:hypothetical protein